MNLKNPIIAGSLILTAAGFLTKILGFFFRIFLSRSIGAEGMGIYQLILPIFALCHTVCCSGTETAISKHVAAEKKNSLSVLCSGFLVSLIPSIICSFILFTAADSISVYIIKDIRCVNLLKCVSFAIPLSVIHSCVNGYYLGLRKAMIPGLTQLSEQIAKTLSVYVCIILFSRLSISLSPLIAIIGTVSGECIAAIISILTLKIKPPVTYAKKYIKIIFATAYPLTLSRTISALLLNIESILIPICLTQYGLHKSDALSSYGILTGMALPLILFPASIMISISSLLLPVISEAESAGNQSAISKYAEKITSFCLITGIFSTFAFICYGHPAGYLLFGNATAGYYITTLAWLCPFLYISITFGSILNGLGKTKTIFYHNIIVTVIKICFTLFGVPIAGISAYLWGLLIGQILICILHFYAIARTYPFHIYPVKNIILPCLFALVAVCVSLPVYRFTGELFGYISYPAILGEGLTAMAVYAGLIYLNNHLII